MRGLRGLATSARDLTRRTSHVEDALRLVRAYAVARYDEGVQVNVRLNVDVKRSDERVRGIVQLPHSTGKVTRVAVFARDALAQEAREAGADAVGAEDLVAEVLAGRLDFDRVLATPDALPALAKAARVLGPKGLMPNPKRGTVITDVADAVRRAKGGEMEFRANPQGLVLGGIGRASFAGNILRDNALAFVYAASPQLSGCSTCTQYSPGAFRLPPRSPLAAAMQCSSNDHHGFEASLRYQSSSHLARDPRSS